MYISTAINGLDAVEIAGKEKLDLILMDVQMPLMDGYKATKSTRKNNKTIPIIAMTANALEGDADMCLKVGMNDYLPKPLEFSLISIALNRWVYGAL